MPFDLHFLLDGKDHIPPVRFAERFKPGFVKPGAVKPVIDHGRKLVDVRRLKKPAKIYSFIGQGRFGPFKHGAKHVDQVSAVL